MNLKHLNTFGFEFIAQNFIKIDNINSFDFSIINRDFVVIGQGSNIIVPDILDKTVIHITDKSITHITPNTIKVCAGMIWHDLVKYCLDNKLYGMENLALIPGTVGASPVQNIGAYGLEVQEFIQSVEVFDTKSQQKKIFCNSECNFAYRDSIFKHTNQYIILSVTFEFKDYEPNLSYKELDLYLKNNLLDINPQNIFDAIVHIRSQKLPNPKVLGNAGSFFKNPIVDKVIKDNLLQQYPNIACFETPNGYKIGAGWMIDQCGFKGFKYKDVGVYEKQALVLVNYSSNKSSQILELANIIQSKVLEKFGIDLEIEPIIL